MQQLILDQTLCRLTVVNQRLLVNRQQEKLLDIPLSNLQQLLVLRKIQFDSSSLCQLAQHKIDVIFCDPQTQHFSTMLITNRLAHSKFRLKQYQLVSSQPTSLNFSKRLLRAKVKQQLQWLALLSESESENPKYLIYQKISRAIDINQLMLLEAHVAKRIFKVWKNNFQQHGFTKRQRRPAFDPVNGLLNFTCSLCHCQCENILAMQGFDPYLGFYHQPLSHRASLACDLMELIRPQIEALLFNQWQQDLWNKIHFVDTEKGCLLSKAGRQKFFKLMQPYLKTWRNQLLNLVTSWKRALL